MKAEGLDCVIGGSVFSCPPKFRMYPVVNGRTCTSCEEAYMGAFKTAWALGFIPQRGITYSIET